MTVSDLIKQLQQYPQYTEVVVFIQTSETQKYACSANNVVPAILNEKGDIQLFHKSNGQDPLIKNCIAITNYNI